MLYQTDVDLPLVREIVTHLLRQHASREPEQTASIIESARADRLLTDDNLKRLIAKHGQNLREMLFDLYDQWRSSA